MPFIDDHWVAVALDGDGEVAFAGIGPSPEDAVVALMADFKCSWTNLMRCEQDASPYYGKFDAFVADFDVKASVPAFKRN